MGARNLWSLSLCLSALSTFALVSGRPQLRDDAAATACQLIDESYSGNVAFPGEEQYVEDIEHFTVTSQQNSTCSVEPADTDELGVILAIIKRSDLRAPFAVKSGGHAYNPGHSSTPGVEISMAKFNEITVDEDAGTVKIGSGLTWDDVYAYLEPYGLTVAGGRVSSIGVGGFSLGGGYSWLSNQVGLTIDTVVGYDIMLPDTSTQFITNDTNPDLFFALRGGLNNFGIVTAITLKTFQQGDIYGGFLIYSENTTDTFTEAISDFIDNNQDPKAMILPTWSYTAGQFFCAVMLYYDGPSPPSGTFDKILAVPAVSGSAAAQPWTQLLPQFGNGSLGIGPFGWAAHSVPVSTYPKELLDEAVTQVKSYGARLQAAHDVPIVVSFSAEPFVNAFAQSQGGAYPHSPDHPLTPSAPLIGYGTNTSVPYSDQLALRQPFVDEMKSFCADLQAKAIALGVTSASDIIYNNYALDDTPLELLYGDNLPRLQELAKAYDPDKVMELTGGFKLQT